MSRPLRFPVDVFWSTVPAEPPGTLPLVTSFLARRVRVGAPRGLRTSPTRRTRLRITLWPLVFLCTAGLLGSCTGKHTIADQAASSTTASSEISSPVTSSPTELSTGTHTSSPQTSSSTPADTAGGDAISPAGVVSPDPHRTPGATNAAVTQATIHQTICVTGWTKTVRPPESYTTSLEEQQLATGYAYRGDMNTSDYEEDQLIPLELGGAPTSTLNLWPEPFAGAEGARAKDQIENKLHAVVCSGSISLVTAQHAIAVNWFTAYRVATFYK
jgi:hypothetical protein